MNKHHQVLSFAALLLLLCVSSTTHAQGSAMWGRDFYTAFPSNEMANYSLGDPQIRFELFVSATVQTTVHIDVPATNYSLDTVIEANSTASILPKLSELTTPEVVDGNTVHLSADNDVQVVAVSHKPLTGDAWVVYPTAILGTSYRPMSLNPSKNPAIFSIANAHPGFFVIIGTRDSTTINIELKHLTSAGSIGPKVITLNSGEAMQFFGDIMDSANDLTGTKIESDKPIVVLGGHRRTETPIDYLYNSSPGGPTSTSRDFLCEEMPPTNLWSKKVIVTPLPLTKAPTMVRILSAEDHNLISVDGSPIGEVQAGAFIEIDSIGASIIEGTKPILVGIYMRTATMNNAAGDPSLSIADRLPLVGGTHHVFVPPDLTSLTSTAVTIIAKSGDIGMITLDNVAPSPNRITPIGSSGYSYADLSIAVGDHLVSATVPYTASVSAVGQVESYTYSLPTSLFADPSLAVRPEKAATTFSLSPITPNPTTSRRAIFAHFSAPSQTLVDWSLFDARGIRWAHGSTRADGSANNKIAITAQQPLHDGVYILQVRATSINGAQTTAAEKIVVAE